MIQGVGVLGTGWLPQLPALTPHFTCLRFDNRGVGQSQPVGSPITIPQLVNDALALMDAPQWDQPLLKELSSAMMDASICGLGQAAPNPVLSVMKFFPQEVA